MLYIARQPILDLDLNIAAYELLFRSSPENSCTASDPDHASKSTVDTALLVGLDKLADGKDIFLNSTAELILGGFARLVPPKFAVIEVLETVCPTPELIDACRQLKHDGYRIALDDFTDGPEFAPLAELADIIKVDFRLSASEQRNTLVKKYGRTHTMLAEKVETHEEFAQARDMGYQFFQGYFFCKPKMVSARNVPWSGASGIRVLRAITKPELDFRELEQIVKAEPALCYRLLRYLNSPAFYLESEVRSILHALRLLGNEKTRRWLLLVVAVMNSAGRNPALVHTALVRARFAELLAPSTETDASEMFMLSLLSLLDVMLEIPRQDLLRQLPVSRAVTEALLGEPNRLGQSLDLILAYERGDWQLCALLRNQLVRRPLALHPLYLDAVSWAQSITGSSFSTANP